MSSKRLKKVTNAILSSFDFKKFTIFSFFVNTRGTPSVFIFRISASVNVVVGIFVFLETTDTAVEDC